MILKTFYDKYLKKILEQIFSLNNIMYFGIKSKRIRFLGINFYKIPKPKKISFNNKCKNITNIYFNNNIPITHKRLAIFASFNKDGKIKDSVVYYIKNLKEITDGIIFVTDNPVIESELKKIEKYITVAQCLRHNEYDFGSYKFGFNLAKKYNLLDGINELILCNDSCYGPINNLKIIFNIMDKKECDFWGLSSDTTVKNHIQSFFYVFKKNVFNHKSFDKYINKIRKQKNIIDVIKKYECTFTDYLEKQNFKSATLVPKIIKDFSPEQNKTCYPLTLMKEYNYPLIKVKAFNNQIDLKEPIEDSLKYIKENNEELYNIILNETGSKYSQTNIIE